MTFEEVKSVFASDQTRAQAFDDALASSPDSGASNDAEALSVAAKAVDLDLSLEEAQRWMAFEQDADEEELAHVTGGVMGVDEDMDGNSIFCFGVQWHCNVTFMHTEGRTEREVCYTNYKCTFISKKGWLLDV